MRRWPFALVIIWLSVALAIPPPLTLRIWAGPTPVSVRLTWDAVTHDPDGSPVTDLSHYRVYQRVNAEPYGAYIQVDAPTTELVVDVSQGSGIRLYRWHVTAVDQAGNESGPSNEVSALVEPPPPPEPARDLCVLWAIEKEPPP